MNREHLNRIKDEIQTKKKYFSLEAILSAAFALLASILAAFLTSSYGFDFSIFLDWKFYISTAVSFVLMMYTFILVKRVVLNSLKKKKDSEYIVNKTRENYLNKYVHDNALIDLIDSAVEVENEIRRKTAAQHILNKITYGLNVDDIEKIEDQDNIAFNLEKFNEFVAKRGMAEKTKWYQWITKKKQRKFRRKLRKAIKKVLNGKYRYDRLTTNDLLIAINDDAVYTKQMKINEAKEEFRENRKKAISFLISTAIMKSLIYDGLSVTFWISLLTEVVLILTSTINAYIVAISRINKLTLVIANRNEFIYKAIKEYLKNNPLGSNA